MGKVNLLCKGRFEITLRTHNTDVGKNYFLNRTINCEINYLQRCLGITYNKALINYKC